MKPPFHRLNWARFAGALLFFLPLLGAAPPKTGAEYFGQVEELLGRHRSDVARFAIPAESTAQALLRGGTLYLAGDPAWMAEGFNRSGGIACVKRLADAAQAKSGDVVWISYDSATYAQNGALGRQLEAKGAQVCYFGPKPPHDGPAGGRWINSFTSWDSEKNFTLLGNMFSLWGEYAELATATVRHGKTLVFLMSHFVRGWQERENLYRGLVFHDGIPAMGPVAGGRLAQDYLSRVEQLISGLRQHELEHIVRLGRSLARHSDSGRPPVLMTFGHMPVYAFPETNPYYRLYLIPNDHAKLHPELVRGDKVIYFGYVSVPPDLWRSVRQAGATATWIVSPLPREVDFTQFGDAVIDQQWLIGDAAIAVPGYDITILPPSGVIQLMIFETMMIAAKN